MAEIEKTQHFETANPAAARALVVAGLLFLAALPLWHIGSNIAVGATAWSQLVAEVPTGETLKAFEQILVDDAPAALAVRPPIARATARWLRRGNQRVVIGREGWLYYRPSLDHTWGPPIRSDLDPGSPGAAIVTYARALAERGIKLVLVPVPGKESIVPEPLGGDWADASEPPRNRGITPLIAALRGAGVDVVDAGQLLWQARARSQEPLFLQGDTHWTPAGLEVVVEAVAARVIESGGTGVPAVVWRPRSLEPVVNHGDLYDMLNLGPGPDLWPPTQVNLARASQGTASAPVLVLGDSFANIYSEPSLKWGERAGFAEQLGYRLALPVDVLALNNGAANDVRAALARQPQRLAATRVVVWEFNVRSLAAAEPAWKDIPLPRSLP